MRSTAVGKKGGGRKISKGSVISNQDRSLDGNTNRLKTRLQAELLATARCGLERRMTREDGVTASAMDAPVERFCVVGGLNGVNCKWRREKRDKQNALQTVGGEQLFK